MTPAGRVALDFFFLFLGIDFSLGVGYANHTFADGLRDDYWGSSCNGQHPLLKRFA
jgi:hypothetical protein